MDITVFYSKVTDGMTKAQVVELAAKDPGSCTESKMQGLGKYESCIWFGSLGESAFVSVSFKDSVVNSKAKTGF